MRQIVIVPIMMDFSSGELSSEPRSRSPKTSEIIARDIASYIVERQLPEGTRLPTEGEMLKILNVGRTTLREALRLLETRGLIVIRSGRNGGPAVRHPRPDDLSEALTLIMQFDGTSLRDILDARQAIECTVARLAATNASSEGIAILRGTIERMLAAPDDQSLFSSENQKFHTGIAEIAENSVLRTFTYTLKSIADGQIVGVQYPPRRVRAVAEAHSRIVTAIESGDSDAAEEAMRAHLSEAGRYWKSNYGHLFRAPVRPRR